MMVNEFYRRITRECKIKLNNFNKTKSKLRRLLAGILAALTVAGAAMSLVGCEDEDVAANVQTPVDSTTEETTTAKETTTEKETEPETEETTTEEETTEEETTKAETEEETTAEETTTANTDKPAENLEDVKEGDTEDGGEKGGNSVAAELKEGVNPLTGIYTGNEYDNKRPVAIMINNLKPSLPQEGISQADVLYECLVEGGLTRLMMVKMDYEDLDAVGSIRSAREYFVDMAQNHHAIYVHAGGATDGETNVYTEMAERKINMLDGVNWGPHISFYRDEERRKIMSYEHTLMTSGKLIVQGINAKRYSTELRDGFVNPFTFAEEDDTVTLDGAAAKHVVIPYNKQHFPQYVYNSKTKLYTRYQYTGQDHIDGATGEKLTFKNVILLVCEHININDEKEHIDIITTGTGKGYYITNGRYVEIKWSKETEDSNMVLTNKDGSTLVMSAGNTMVNLISPGVDYALTFNYDKDAK